MNCDDLLPLFSDRLDGALDEQARARFDAHVSECADCTREWREFQQATGALQSLGVPPLEAGYVDAVVGAALSATPAAASITPRSWRRVASHAAALLLGAALFGAFAREGAPAEPEVREVVRTEIREVLVPGPTPEPELVIEWRERTAVEIEYVDREVVREVEVERPVEVFVRDRSFEGTLATIGEGLAAWGSAVSSFERELTPIETQPEDEVWVRQLTRSDPPPQRPLAEPTRDATLVVRRDEGRVSLRTRGTLEEIVPALIARLEDEDPAIQQAVESRLLEIQSQLGGSEATTVEVTAGDGFGPIGWRRWWPEESEDAAEESSATERWSAWWLNTRADLDL